MNIYLDVDGVLLKKDGTLAEGFDEFLDFFVNNHECYWLTTHCRGGENQSIQHIQGKNELSEKQLELLEKIKPLDWYSLKTDAIDFSKQFVWFDDYVMSGERMVLLENNAYMRLHTIDLRNKPGQLRGMLGINYDRAEPTDWQEIDLELAFTPEEFEKIKKGFVSDKGMDERWRFLFEGGTLYVLGHWVANVMYKMKFRFHDGKYITTEVYLVKNLEKDGYEAKVDELFQKNWHGIMIVWLIEKYLLGRNRKFLFEQGIYGNMKIPIDSIHGYVHWKNVERIGHYLADRNGADKKVMSVFAFLHDIGRTVEYEEPLHGERSRELILKNFNREDLGLDADQFEFLLEAVTGHNKDSAKSANLTVQTCWDADRLDLPRVYIFPDKKRLFTDVAKSDETFKYFGLRNDISD